MAETEIQSTNERWRNRAARETNFEQPEPGNIKVCLGNFERYTVATVGGAKRAIKIYNCKIIDGRIVWWDDHDPQHDPTTDILTLANSNWVNIDREIQKDSLNLQNYETLSGELPWTSDQPKIGIVKHAL